MKPPSSTARRNDISLERNRLESPARCRWQSAITHFVHALRRELLVSTIVLCAAVPEIPSIAGEPTLPRYYIGQLETQDGERQEVCLVLETPAYEPATRTLSASGVEWYRVAKGYRSISIRVVVELDSHTFTLTYLPSASDRAQETPSVDPLVGIITMDLALATNDYRDESRAGYTDFLFKATHALPVEEFQDSVPR